MITDEDGGPIRGVDVMARGLSAGTLSDRDGRYTLLLPEGTRFVFFSKLGWSTLEVPIGSIDELDVTLTRGIAFDDIATVGASPAATTVFSATAPIDILPVATLQGLVGQRTLNELLTYESPNFVANPQVLSGGSDFIDPSSLRGFGPNQVLVLVNGKRRHKTAQLNLAPAFGRGTVGTDLDAIPIAAVERIEVLRDGASARYGSDAVAGVINIVLKQKEGLSIDAIGGGRLSEGVPAPNDNIDGEVAQIGLNYGVGLGRRGGILNLTAQADLREPTNRALAFTGPIFSGYNFPDEATPGGQDITETELARRGLSRADFTSRVGQAATRQASVFANLSLPVSRTTSLYGFGGVNYRLGETKARYGLPNAPGTVTDLYPNGFLPEINGVVLDQSASLGIRQTLGAWHLDLSHTFGRNEVTYEVVNTNNASLGSASPTVFDPGEYAFAQNTSAVDLSRYFPSTLAGISVSSGVEYRHDAYRATAGEEASYRDYGAGSTATVVDPIGRRRPGGVQGFDAIRPEDARFVTRYSASAYAEVDASLTRALTLSAGGRYEYFSDVDRGLAAKLAVRYLINRDLNVRASASSGYRAPSLHQVAYTSTQPGLLDGRGTVGGVFAAGSDAANALGIEALQLERNQNLSIGFTGRVLNGRLGFSGDAFQVEVADRTTLTAPFGTGEGRRDITAILQEVGVTEAAFFVNALETRTRGLDGRITQYATLLGDALQLETSLGATYTTTIVQRVRTSVPLLGAEDTYLPPSGRQLLQNAVPRTSFLGSVKATCGPFEVFARAIFFGFVADPGTNGREVQNLGGRTIGDLSLCYRPSAAIYLTLGVNNLLDTYPEALAPTFQENGQSRYSRTTQQFGANGRLVFARVGIALDK